MKQVNEEIKKYVADEVRKYFQKDPPGENIEISYRLSLIKTVKTRHETTQKEIGTRHIYDPATTSIDSFCDMAKFMLENIEDLRK